MRLAVAALLLLLSTGLASAQLTMTNVGGGGGGAALGPGDIVGGWTFWFGNRPFTAVIANAGTTAAARFERDSDSHLCDILVGAAGLTNTSNCSTGGDNGTAVGTWCAATTCRYVTFYDQTGNARSPTQVTNSQRPIYTAAGANGKPCATFTASASSSLLIGSAIPAPPYTLSVVYNATLETSASFQAILNFGVTSDNMIYAHGGGSFDSNGANTNGVGSQAFTIADGSLHGINEVSNGASSAYNADGLDTTYTQGTSGTAATFSLGNVNGSTNFLDGCIAEAGLNPAAASSGNRAALWTNQHSWYTIPAAVGSGAYTGPGDVVAAPTHFYALRGATQSYSNGVNHGAIIRRASDNALYGAAISSTGDLNISGALAFAGTDAVCTGSQTASATLVITGCASGTVHVGDQISGTGVTSPTFITAIGTCGAGAGSCATNSSQTYAAATITATVAMYIAAWPDQGLTGYTAGQTLAANQAELLANCLNITKPCAYFNGTTDGYAAAWAAGAQPNTITNVMERLGGFTTQQNVIETNTSVIAAGFYTSTNTVFEYAGSFVTATASDSAPHSIQFGLSGTSSFINVDGSNTSVSAGTNAYSGTFTLGSSAIPNGWVNGYITEDGTWPSLFSAPNQSTMHTNMSAYWGTP